jgi:tripartite-type tricarboxylate transporter receptor subunit TctC
VITRRLGLLGGLSLVAAAPVRAAADQRITMMIGAPAGSGADKIGRDFVTCFESHFGSADIGIRNLPGDAGWAMLSALADAPPTGAAIGWVTTPALPARMIDRGDPDLAGRIRLVGMVEREPVAFVSPASDPVNSVQDVIQKAGNDADAMPLGTPPAGSPPHLAALRLQALAQTRLNIVTFPSAAAAYQAVLAGNVSAAALGLSDVIDGIHDGSLSAIGLAARRRFGVLPDTPVLNEAGIPLAAFIARGIGVPAGTPAELVGRLETAMRGVAEDEDFRTQAEARGYHVMWHDGATWVAEMQAEQAELASLWATDPWLSSSGG